MNTESTWNKNKQKDPSTSVILLHEGGMQEIGDPHEPGSGHNASPAKLHPLQPKISATIIF